jgi:hypothetical protein
MKEVVQLVDLTAGDANVIGNRGDIHTFRLSNPTGETIIETDGQYEAEFDSSFGMTVPIDLDTSELATGVLTFLLTIESGTYRVRRLDPQKRTILTVEVRIK